MQVEVDRAVDQDAAHTKHAGQSHRAAHLTWPISDLLDASGIKHHHEPEHGCEAQQAHFHEQLQVIVVRFVDEEVGIESAELRIHDRKCSQAPPQNGLLEEHAKAVAVDVGANVAGKLGVSGAGGGDTPAEFAAADPDQQADDDGEENADADGGAQSALSV